MKTVEHDLKTYQDMTKFFNDLFDHCFPAQFRSEAWPKFLALHQGGKSV